jgi:hypothetical protein
MRFNYLYKSGISIRRQRYFRVLNAGARFPLRVFEKIILASLAVFFQKTLHRLNTPTFFCLRMKNTGLYKTGEIITN